MNKPDINRSILRMHIATVEARYPIKIIGILPRGSAAHVFEDNALDFLAEKRPGLTYFGVGGVENDLTQMLGRPVGVVLASELQDSREVQEFRKIVEPV